ncbi:10676_t:CDS:2, partial [Entrophospora sp. SA101]
LLLSQKVSEASISTLPVENLDIPKVLFDILLELIDGDDDWAGMSKHLYAFSIDSFDTGLIPLPEPVENPDIPEGLFDILLKLVDGDDKSVGTSKNLYTFSIDSFDKGSISLPVTVENPNIPEGLFDILLKLEEEECSETSKHSYALSNESLDMFTSFFPDPEWVLCAIWRQCYLDMSSKYFRSSSTPSKKIFTLQTRAASVYNVITISSQQAPSEIYEQLNFYRQKAIVAILKNQLEIGY